MNRDGQATYWYLMAIGAQKVPVQQASWDSGIPEDSIYKVIRDYPTVFALDGNCIAWARLTRHSRRTP